MKGILTAAALAAVIIAGSIAYVFCLSGMSEELLEINTSVTECVRAEEFEEASAMLRRMQSYIDDRRTAFSVTGRHDMLDTIEINIAELAVYIDCADKTDALSRCAELGILLRNVPRNYRFKIGNVL